ncbi:MAG: hypothetical protein AAFQ98_03375 [Bacteroidota bacterium]
MIKNLIACLLLIGLVFPSHKSQAQSTITLTVTEVSTTIPDCDGIINDSDPAWYYTGADIDNQCYETVCNGCTESVSLELFNHTYSCLAEVPASITVTLSGCEYDGIQGCIGGAFGGSCDGDPGQSTQVLTVPTTAGTSVLNFSDNSTGCVGTWTHTLEWNVTSTLTDVNITVSTVGETITSNQATGTYRWLDCNDSYSIISGETAQSYTPTTNGAYAVEVTNTGCVDTSSCVVISSLPVELVSFEARRNKHRVDLKWLTATELNNDYFTIERSQDLITWQEVLRQNGAGNSHAMREYTAVDNQPWMGTSYYRLKQTDFDGQFAFSEVEVVDGAISQPAISINPSFVRNELTLEGQDIEANRINLLDPQGKDLTCHVKVIQASSTRMVLGLADLPAGIYFIALGTSVHKLYKQ